MGMMEVIIYIFDMCFCFYYVDFIIYKSHIFSSSIGHIKSYFFTPGNL